MTPPMTAPPTASVPEFSIAGGGAEVDGGALGAVPLTRVMLLSFSSSAARSHQVADRGHRLVVLNLDHVRPEVVQALLAVHRALHEELHRRVVELLRRDLPAIERTEDPSGVHASEL